MPERLNRCPRRAIDALRWSRIRLGLQRNCFWLGDFGEFPVRHECIGKDPLHAVLAEPGHQAGALGKPLQRVDNVAEFERKQSPRGRAAFGEDFQNINDGQEGHALIR
jgi:hypothetical protein